MWKLIDYIQLAQIKNENKIKNSVCSANDKIK